jgi:tRNA/rRNA methyltransferase
MPSRDALPAEVQASLSQIRIVLVEPQHSGNIGAVARAMKNMALTQLVLVNPADHLNLEARMMAMHALDLLQNARVYADLTQAVADAGFVVGTTRRLGKARQAHLTPRAIVPLLLSLAHSNPVALVFGREDSGLTNEELQRCHELLTIPAHPEDGSLNLAQAVLLVCYELYMATAGESRPIPPKLATVGELERLYQRLRQVLWRVGFLHGSHPDRMMGYFRQFFARGNLRSRDVKIFLGVLRQIEWYLNRHSVPPESRPQTAAAPQPPLKAGDPSFFPPSRPSPARGEGDVKSPGL